MKASFVVVRALLGVTGALQLVLGIVFWTGNALGLIPLHMAVGGVFVLSLWVLAVLCARAAGLMGLAAATIVWGALLLVVGAIQMRIMPGPSHWVVQVAHLLMAVVAMALGGMLGARARSRIAQPAEAREVAEPRRA